jgi:hypothetical protein
MLPHKRAELTERERQLLALLPISGEPVTSTALVQALYGAFPPLNARETVIDRMRKIIRKLEHNNDAIRIGKSERNGPHPIEYWRISPKVPPVQASGRGSRKDARPRKLRSSDGNAHREDEDVS